MKTKSRIVFEYIIVIGAFSILIMFATVIYQSTSNDEKNKKEAYRIIDNLKIADIINVEITFLNGENEGEKVNITDSTSLIRLKSAFLHLKYFYSGNGRMVGKQYQIEFFSKKSKVLNSVIYVNGISTLINIVLNEKEFELENSYTFINKDIENILSDILKISS